MSDNKKQATARSPRQRGPRHGGGNVAEKPKDFLLAWKNILIYSKNFIPAILIAFIFSIVSAVLSILGPDKLKDLGSEIQKAIPTNLASINASIDMNAVYAICMTLVLMYSGSFVFGVIQSLIMREYTQRLAKNLRYDMSRKLNKVPLKYLDQQGVGNILSRFTNDVDILAQTLNQSVSMLLSAVVLFFGSLIMMFYTSWQLALTAIASTVLGFVLMIVIMSKSQKHFVAQQQNLGVINGQVEETYTGHDVVTLYNGTINASKTFAKTNNKLYVSAWKSQFYSGIMMPIMQFIGNFGFVAVCVVGALLVTQGTIDFPVIIAFMIYIRLFTQPLSTMAQAATQMQSAAAGAERVFELINEEEMTDESDKIDDITLVENKIKGNVEFKHVNFGYFPNKTIINDFSAVAKAGQKIAIVGPTGAGKTTMVNLLMRFYDIDSGEIFLDGINISDMTRRLVHEQFCMVLQDTWLVNGTIRENIIYSMKDVDDEQMIRASKAVGLHHFVKTLPHGYDTVIDEKTNLSVGQKQLVTIARAMVENAPLLILDEATSSVDTRTEILIQNAMDKLTEGRTSFVIAHRLSTIKNADLILVMNNGDIVESGNHEELLAQNGFYADLYNSQFTED